MGVFDTAVPLGLSAGGLIVAYFYPNGKPLIEIEDAPAEMVALTLSK